MNILIAFGGLAALSILIVAGVPIAVALGLISLIGISILIDGSVAMSAAGLTPFETIASWHLSAIPMFILMGGLANGGGISQAIFEAARVWTSRVLGGPLIAANIASAIFAAASGSSLATAAAMARLALPQMARSGFDLGFAAAAIASAGTVGALIPPSILFIIYGIFSQTSVGKLFLAGILPGLLTILIYCLAILLVVWLRPSIAPRWEGSGSDDWSARFRALSRAWPGGALVAIVIGGIYLGVFTPVEAGAAGAATTLCIRLVGRTLGWASIREALLETVTVSGQIFFIAIGATLFKQFLLLSGITPYLESVAAEYIQSPAMIMIVAFLVFLVLGAFLDAIGLIFVTLPIFIPMFNAVGADMIWAGVLMVKFVEIGVLTPPVGLHVFVVTNIASAAGCSVPVERVFKNITVFFVCELFIVTLLIAFPEISLLIPRMME